MDSVEFVKQTPESVRRLLKELSRSVSVGFPISEEEEFVRTCNYQTVQKLKHLTPILHNLQHRWFITVHQHVE